MLHFDNVTEGGVVFTDDGFLPSTWTAVGGAKTTLTDFKFAPSSLTLNGTTDWITTVATGLNVLTTEFTLYTWFKCTAPGGTQRNLLGQTNSLFDPLQTSMVMFRDTGNHINAQVFQGSTPINLVGTTQFTNALNAGWHMVALVRDNTDAANNHLYLYIDGHLEASSIIHGNVNTSSAMRAIGQMGGVTTNPWMGFVDETVIVLGKAMWKGGVTFTPPTAPQPRYGAGAEAPWDSSLPIIAGTNWAPGIGKNEDLVMLENGAILSDPAKDGTFGVVCKEGLNSTREPPPYFCVGGGEDIGQPRKMFMFSSVNQLQMRKGDATTFAAIATPPADWAGAGNFPITGCVHEQRLFGAGNASDPHRIYYSSVTSHETFTGTGAGAAGTIPVFPGQGERIVGMYSIRGALIIWKYPVGVYVLQTVDPDPTTWSVMVLSRSVGAVSPHSIVQIENDVLFMDRTGSIHSLTATNDFGDFNTSNLSEIASLAPFIREEVNRNKLQRTQAIYYTNKRQAWFGVPRLNTDVPNLRLIVGFPDPNNPMEPSRVPRFFMSRRDKFNALWLRPDNADGVLKPAIAGDNGCIYTLDEDACNKDYNQGYPIQFSSADTDLSFADQGLATRSKNGDFLEIVYEPQGQWDLLVDIFWDDIYNDTVAFSMGGAGNVIGSFVLDSDVLGSAGVRQTRRRIPGSGRRFRMTCHNDGVNQQVAIAGFFLSFTPGDERTPQE
jgi:hypothetical protein